MLRKSPNFLRLEQAYKNSSGKENLFYTWFGRVWLSELTFSSFYSFRTPDKGMQIPTFRVGLYPSDNQLRKHITEEHRRMLH